MSRVFHHTPAGSYCDNVSTLLTPSTSSYTYSAWIFPTAFGGSSWGAIISSVGGNAMDFRAKANGVLDGITTTSGKTTSGAISANNTIVLNQWQYVTYTYNSTTMISSLFVNGVEVSYASRTTGSGVSAQTMAPMVGNSTTTGTITGFDGAIDSVAIWNVILSPAQLLAASAYRGALSVLPGNLVAFWDLLGAASPEPETPVNTFPLTVSNATQGSNSPGENSAPADLLLLLDPDTF